MIEGAKGAASKPKIHNWKAEAKSLQFKAAKRTLLAAAGTAGTVALYGALAPEPIVSKATAVGAAIVGGFSLLGALGAHCGEKISASIARTPIPPR